MTSKAEALNWLEQIAERQRDEVKAGAAPTPEKLSVRTLVGYFGFVRRTRAVSQLIRNALEQQGLRTNPDFEGVWLDREITMELEDSNAGTDEEGAFEDPTVRIDALPAAHRNPVVAHPDKPLSHATTLMLLHDYSQLPITQNRRKIRGMITWKSIGSRLASGIECNLVHDCINPHVEEVRLGAPLLDAVAGIASHGYTLVRDRTDLITGIVTASDLAREFQELASPFLLIGEIEKYLHTIVHGRFTVEELQTALPEGLKAAGTADLTLGGYVRLLEKPDNWERQGLAFSREEFIDRLKAVRQIRNEVMHFRPDGLDSDELQDLQKFVEFLRHLARMGVVSTAGSAA